MLDVELQPETEEVETNGPGDVAGVQDLVLHKAVLQVLLGGPRGRVMADGQLDMQRPLQNGSHQPYRDAMGHRGGLQEQKDHPGPVDPHKGPLGVPRRHVAIGLCEGLYEDVGAAKHHHQWQGVVVLKADEERRHLKAVVGEGGVVLHPHVFLHLRICLSNARLEGIGEHVVLGVLILPPRGGGAEPDCPEENAHPVVELAVGGDVVVA
mmetsp:Transcript_21885/g.60754  ORF Transcript_21885/g.60754 Transcript_21885/m.60754 type:complete len:209 (+) Transcript_21885:225-851(+)